MKKMPLRAWVKEKVKFLKSRLAALYLAYRRPDTPLAAKIAAAAAVGYALSPIDLIPDFIPIIGYLDDALILPLLITLAIKLIPPAIMQDCLRQAEEQQLWTKGKPKSWKYALPIIGIWVLIIALIIYKIFF